jgi:4-oxalocrotonate tautomerase
MPLVEVKVMEGVFSQDKRRQIVEGVTEAMVAIEGEGLRGVTWVLVEEVRSGDWGIGGRPITTEDVQTLAAGVAS